MCRFIETIQLREGQLKNLNYHQDRVDRTFSHFFPEHYPLQLQEFFNELSLPQRGNFRCTLTYTSNKHSLNLVEYKPRDIKYLRLIEDDEIEYSWKYAQRKLLNKHLEKLPDNEEIIIIKKGFVTDTSYTNLIFYDNKNWYTPLRPLLKGTKRQKLLDEGRIFEREIKVNDLKKFSSCSLINAMLEPGEIQLKIQNIIAL